MVAPSVTDLNKSGHDAGRRQSQAPRPRYDPSLIPCPLRAGTFCSTTEPGTSPSTSNAVHDGSTDGVAQATTPSRSVGIPHVQQYRYCPQEPVTCSSR
eukprot:11139395-Ditylum_brightwellii.AAC.1